MDGRLIVTAAAAAGDAPPITIRRMILADAGAIGALLQQSPEAAQWARESIAESAQTGAGWVAQAGRSVVGFLIGRVAADEFEILNMAVARAYRGRGLGGRLIQEALAWAVKTGARQAHLEVRASNRAAVRLYERAGFRETGYRKNYYSDPVEDALVLTLILLENSC